MVSIAKHSKEVFVSGTLITVLFMLVLGFMFPATDIVEGEAHPHGELEYKPVPFVDEEGNYDRGLWTNWFAYIFFTGAILMLGKSLYATFLKMDMQEWNWFALGTFMLFIYGLSGIFQQVFDHNLFEMLKDIALPIGLSLMAYSSYKIYEPFEEDE